MRRRSDAELRRSVVALVAVLVEEVVLGDRLAAGVDGREAVGEVVVVAPVERLDHVLPFAGEVVGHAEPRRDVGVGQDGGALDVGGARREDALAVGGDVGDERLAHSVAVADLLVVEAHADCEGQLVVRRPAILDVAGVVQIGVRAHGPAVAVVAGGAGVNEADAIRSAGRVGASVRVADLARRAVVAVAVRVEDALEPELEVVAAGLLGQVVGELGLELRLLAGGAERVPAGAGHRRSRTEQLGRVGRRVDLDGHRPVEREVAAVDVEEGAVAQHFLPLALVHPRIAVLGPHRFGRQQRRDAAARLLLAALLEVADEGVVLERPVADLAGVVVEDAEVARTPRAGPRPACRS